MDFLEKIDRIVEGRRPYRGRDYPKGHPSRGSGPSTLTTHLGGEPGKRGRIHKSVVTSTGTRPSGRGLRRGQVKYTRTTDRPRSETHPGQDHGPLADVPASKPAPIEGRLRDVVHTVKTKGLRGAAVAGVGRAKAAVKHAATSARKTGKKAVAAVKRAAAKARGSSTEDNS